MDNEPSPYVVHHLTSLSGPKQPAQQVLLNPQVGTQPSPPYQSIPFPAPKPVTHS